MIGRFGWRRRPVSAPFGKNLDRRLIGERRLADTPRPDEQPSVPNPPAGP